MDDTAGTRAGLDQLHVDTSLLQCISADEAGEAAADHQCWDAMGHGDGSIRAGSESFRKERLGIELLFFQIGIETHGEIADEDAAEPSGANLVSFQEHEAILARGLKVVQVLRKIGVKVHAQLSGNFVFDSDRVAKQAADHGAPQASVAGEALS